MGEQVRVQATSGRDWGQEAQLKSSSLMKERVEVPAEIWRRAGLGRLC